jgi:epoxyqueuosine reductase
MGRWVFGCDVCQEVCPHNVQPTDPLHEAFAPENAWLDLEWVLGASPDQINTDLAGTPLRRPGPLGLKRNAAVVLGNLKDPAAIPVLRPLASHPDAMLAEHARWALAQLGG